MSAVLLLTLLAPVITAPPTAAEALAWYGRAVPEAILEYQSWDLTHRGGKGDSDSRTSGDLGWGESTFLRNYVSCYRVTGDPYWLDKFIDHFDRMLANQHDRNGDGFLAWDSIRYSVGIVKVVSSSGADGLELTPATRRVDVTSGGERITGHHYAVTFPTADTVRVLDLDRKDMVIADTPYPGFLVLDPCGGKTYPGEAEAKAAQAYGYLVLKGPGRAQAQFRVETVAPEWIEFVVHDGMVTYPMAQFCELVLGDASLPARYGDAARRYLGWFEQQIHRKWAKYWLQVDATAGAYTFTASVTERYPNYLLPHNQYLALARAYLVLQAIEAVPQPLRGDYRTKAVAMLTYFRRYLRPALDGRAYVWNYWDPPAGQDLRRHVEDYSHATIDVGAVIEAAQRGLVFTADDVVKLARTYTDVMSGGDPESDKVTPRVDGTGNATNRAWWEWIRTGLYDTAAFRKGLRAGAAVPTVCEMLADLGAVTADDRRQAVANTAQLQQLVATAADGNLSFELGVGGQVAAWTFQTWSADAGGGTFEWSTDAVDGQRSAALCGTQGTPNLVLEMGALEFDRPTKITVSLQYKTEAEAKPYLSFIANVPDGERQYDSSPRLERSETWRKASWSFTTRPGVTVGRFYLRNGGLGTVWYDALTVTREPVK